MCGKAGHSPFQGSSAREPSQPSPLPRKGFRLPAVGLLSLEKSTLSLSLEPISSAFKCWLVMCSTLFGGEGVFNLSHRVKTRSLYKWTAMTGSASSSPSTGLPEKSQSKIPAPGKCSVHWEAVKAARRENWARAWRPGF